MKYDIKEYLVGLGVEPSLLAVDTYNNGPTVPLSYKQVDQLRQYLPWILQELRARLQRANQNPMYDMQDALDKYERLNLSPNSALPNTVREGLGIGGRDLWLLGYIYASILDEVVYVEKVVNLVQLVDSHPTDISSELNTLLAGVDYGNDAHHLQSTLECLALHLATHYTGAAPSN